MEVLFTHCALLQFAPASSTVFCTSAENLLQGVYHYQSQCESVCLQVLGPLTDHHVESVSAGLQHVAALAGPIDPRVGSAQV